MHYKVQVRKAKPGKPSPNFIPPPSVSQSANYDRALALQCAELINQLMHDYFGPFQKASNAERHTKAEQNMEEELVEELVAKKLISLLLSGLEDGESEVAGPACIGETARNEKKDAHEAKHENTAKDDLVHFYQEVLRELGCDVRVERTKIPEFTGSAFHMVPAVKHTITNKEGYHKEITYL